MIKLAAISNSPERKYAEVHCLRMSEAEGKMQNKSGAFQPLGYARQNTKMFQAKLKLSTTLF